MEIRKLAPGDRVLDYRVLERLGEGGFGEVFRAEHEVLETIVALKVPRDQGSLTALRHEGVVQAQLDHPGIVRTRELSISHNPPYVIMDFVDGKSLSQILKRSGGYPWRKAAKLLIQVAEALSYAHSKGVIHGDIKPGNVLVERKKTGRVMLTDFGLGKVFEGPQGNLQISRSLELASSGKEVQGTIRYLAPELLRGESADERADMYSFGVLLFETVTGRLPEGREIPSDLVKDLPPTFDRIFERMFTRRERRPRSLDKTLEELRELVEPKSKAKVKAKAKKDKAPEIVKAIPADTRSARRHDPTPASATPSSLDELRNAEGFGSWRDALVEQIGERIAAQAGVAICDGRGFDVCYGVTTEGEPHHRVYALVLPKVDAAAARAAVAEARRIFDQEKGIWEKEVTFWVIAQNVEDQNQVLWTLKSFSMGWWRRRRIVLQDVQNDRLYATELGCDPRGNPLKRTFLAACDEALKNVPPVSAAPSALACRSRRRVVRGTAWGAALALTMFFTLVGSIMAVEMKNRKVNKSPEACPAFVGSDTPTISPVPALPPAEPEAFTPQQDEEPPPPEYY